MVQSDGMADPPHSHPTNGIGLPLGPALLRAADWFNDAFVGALAAQGWPRLSRSQAQLLLMVEPNGTSPAELARRLDMTRQSMGELIKVMMAHGLITQEPNPADARSILVKLTPTAHALGQAAAVVQVELDRLLADRIGSAAVAELRSILSADWGPPGHPHGAPPAVRS